MAKTDKSSKPVMYWTKTHDIVFLREVVLSNPFQFKKRSTERTKIYGEIAQRLNRLKGPCFTVDVRGVREHVQTLVDRQKSKNNLEERASGIAPPEPSDSERLITEIIDLQKDGAAETEKEKKKEQEDKAKGEDARLKSMEKMSQTKRREGGAGNQGAKRQRRSGGDAIEYLKERAEATSASKEEELKIKRERSEQQMQLQQQHADMMKQMQVQQQQYQHQQQQFQQQQQQLQQQQMLLMQQVLGVMGKMVNN